MVDITDADYADAKIVCKDFEIISLWEYHGSKQYIIVSWCIW